MSRRGVLAGPSGPGNGPCDWLPTGQCRIPGCGTRVGRTRLMCRRDWYLVPKHLRDRIWATWRSGAGVSGPAYRQAVADAVAIVQATAAPAAAPPEPRATGGRR